jgi:cell division protein FtsB
VTIARWVSLGVLLLAVLFALERGEFSETNYLRLRRQERDAEAQLVELRRVVDSLRSFRDSLRSNPAVQERVARERWGMLRPGELVVTVPSPDSVRSDSLPW